MRSSRDGRTILRKGYIMKYLTGLARVAGFYCMEGTKVKVIFQWGEK